MASIASIHLTYRKRSFAFCSAKRTEALGGRLRWMLETADPAVEQLAGHLPSSGIDSSPRFEGEIVFQMSGEGETVKVPGPFRMRACERRRSHLELILEQTVEEEQAIQPKFAAWHLPKGDFIDWLGKGPLDTLLSAVPPELQNAIQGSFGGREAVVLQVGQTDVEMAAWLAWAFSHSTEEFPSWIVGNPNGSWRLVRDSDAAMHIEEPQSHWRAGIVKTLDVHPDCTFLRIDSRVTSFEYRRDLTSTEMSECLTAAYLPKRISIDGVHRWVVARHDTWANGPLPWHVELELADHAPWTAWTPSSLAPSGRILGRIASQWSGQATIQCAMDSCSATFPGRLTTFDAGSSSIAGWQWVPTAENRICLDPDWSLGALPAVAYIERHEAVKSPYILQLPAGQTWLGKVGSLTWKFIQKGLRID